MGKMQRTKGATWERRIVNDLKEHHIGATRTAPLQTDGHPVPDVQATPLWIEAKVGKQPPIILGLQQALATCPATHIACCVAKKDRQAPTITMLWDDFLELFQEWKERGER